MCKFVIMWMYIYISPSSLILSAPHATSKFASALSTNTCTEKRKIINLFGGSHLTKLPANQARRYSKVGYDILLLNCTLLNFTYAWNLHWIKQTQLCIRHTLIRTFVLKRLRWFWVSNSALKYATRTCGLFLALEFECSMYVFSATPLIWRTNFLWLRFALLSQGQRLWNVRLIALYFYAVYTSF